MAACLAILAFIVSLASSLSEEPAFKSYATLDEYYKHEPTSETPAVQILMKDQSNDYGAYCLDGTVPDFYYRAGTGDGKTKFHMYLQGGGWCASLNQCAERTGTDLGSSKFDQQYSNIGGVPYLSSNQSINPLTYNWNSIYIRYCDGTSYSGNNDTLTKYNSTLSLRFRGWRILNGVLNTLRDSYNLSLATDVLLSGCSAGALGVFFHANYVYDWILELKDNKPFNYMSMPDAGYFMEVNHYIGMMHFCYDYSNLTVGLNQDCVKYYKDNNMDIRECMYAVNIAPFIKVKMFSTQSQYDSNQIANAHTNSSVVINEYGQNLTYWYLDRYINTSTKHYGWLVSCYQHCTTSHEWNDIVIDGYDISQAQVNAFYGNTTYGQLLFQNKTYPCNSCC